MRATLKSILAQSEPSFEILLMDDANSPDVAELAASLGDSRIKYHGNPTTLGPALNHARGISLACGKYVAIVNHDDLWEPETLDTLLSGLERHPDCVAAFSRPRVTTADGRFDESRTSHAWTTWDLTDVPAGRIGNWARDVRSTRLAFPSVVCALMRTPELQAVKIPAAVGGSYDFWIGYQLSRTHPVLHLDEAVGYWREHPDNLTRVRSAKRSFEMAYIYSHVALDRALPPKRRLYGAARLPRAYAVTAADYVRGARQGR
ncbi:glycosyltransferase [Nocardioides sp. ChNu-153]|nr:glycosyltransferase family 2 protein [Nocardioides sp. ChNu-99]MDN7122293.1 glycosyltransferase [Nocardioides sp. ChNu-153]